MLNLAIPADSLSWQETVDVVVVGSGFAGLAAAFEAKSAGCSVRILEKMKGYGGNSVISDGAVAAAGTDMQQSQGIADSGEQMLRDMLRAGLSLNHPELARTVAEQSKDALEWSIALGARYQKRVQAFGGHSRARSHLAHRTSGFSIIKPMLSACRELGLEIARQHKLQRLISNAQGRVCGVRVREGYTYPDRNSGVPKNIKARLGVVLAAGGFGNDLSLRRTQVPDLNESVDSTNKPSTTGEVLRQAMAVGAMPVHLSWIQLGPWGCPDEKGYGVGPGFASYIAMPYGIMVNPDTGRRFMNESADRKTRADAILNVGRPCICIADSRGVEQSGYDMQRCLDKDVVRRFTRLSELAAAYDIPEAPLEASLEEYNTTFVKGTPDPFGRSIHPQSAPLKHPPYYAMRVWPKVHHTMGGLQIDTRARVLDTRQRFIPGLFAAGEVTGGIHGACRLGSCAITDCLVFGRIAGKNAARTEQGTPRAS